MASIRREKTADIPDIHRVNEAAFKQKTEADIVDALRSRGALTVSLVAVLDGHLVGHIAFSPVTVKSSNADFTAIGLGPMAVLPEHQRHGIGSQLVQTGLEACRELGYDFAVVVGHPNYYPRFGFTPGKAKGLICEYDVPDEAWMVVELKNGSLNSRRGTVYYQPMFRKAV